MARDEAERHSAITLFIQNYYLTHEVRCVFCGKTYTPALVPYLDKLNVAPIMANNWCSRKCYVADMTQYMGEG